MSAEAKPYCESDRCDAGHDFYTCPMHSEIYQDQPVSVIVNALRLKNSKIRSKGCVCEDRKSSQTPHILPIYSLELKV